MIKPSGEACDRCGRAVARHDLGEHHLAAGVFDELATDNLVEPVVGAFDEELRADCPDQIERRVFIEDDDQIDRSERCEDRGRAD